jgi:hypothetical protein
VGRRTIGRDGEMRHSGWDEPAEASGRPPGGSQAPWQLPGHTGLVEAGGYAEQPLPPAGWRPVATGRPSRVWPPTRQEIVAAVGTVVALAAVGLPVALLWRGVAPRLGFRIVSSGNPVPVVPETEQFFAADGWFAVLTLAVGVLAAVLLWQLRSARGPTALVGLALGGLAGAVVTWKFAVVLAPGPSDAALHQVGNLVYPALRLRALAELVVEPITAVIGYLVFTGFAGRNDLGSGGPPPEPDPVAG